MEYSEQFNNSDIDEELKQILKRNLLKVKEKNLEVLRVTLEIDKSKQIGSIKALPICVYNDILNLADKMLTIVTLLDHGTTLSKVYAGKKTCSFLRI